MELLLDRDLESALRREDRDSAIKQLQLRLAAAPIGDDTPKDASLTAYAELLGRLLVETDRIPEAVWAFQHAVDHCPEDFIEDRKLYVAAVVRLTRYCRSNRSLSIGLLVAALEGDIRGVIARHGSTEDLSDLQKRLERARTKMNAMEH